MSSLRVALVAALVAAGLAGCTDPEENAPPTNTTTPTPTTEEPTPTPTPTPEAEGDYTLTAEGIPEAVRAGMPFDLTLTLNGAPAIETQHIGAHYADNTTGTPSAPGRGDCTHTSGAVPGAYNVSCTLTAPGTWYVYGHLQTSASGTLRNYWAEPVAVTVYDYTVNVSETPLVAVAGVPFSFNVTVDGEPASRATHAGAHYADNATAAPTMHAMVACEHAHAEAPGSFTATCTIEEPGTWYVYGHYQTGMHDTMVDFWSRPFEVHVA